ncbi:GPI transamidase component PIG-T-like [Amphiura filiformis]|uniref:GPI transamidase component PIG-T-like n=1 Tax=Amphiura filiformis TaxID=82378 RepID=UPI003B2256A8
MSTAVLWLVFCMFTAVIGHVLAQDQFHEELLIKPIQTGHVYAQFKFTTLWNVSLNHGQSFSHYNLFPKSLGQVVSKYSVQELHLSLTQGQWRQDKWGYPVNSAPPGAQLWVWFQPTTKSVDDAWAGLVNALSGLFCASLNFVDATNTITPKLSFRPAGTAKDSYTRSSGKYLRYATLPREIVCTENLTPWKKLLPCDSKAGLSTLFHAGHLYNANYHSLSVDLRPVCSDYPSCTSPALELTQSLGVVFEPPIHNHGKQDWTLASLFERPILKPCPLASVSKVYVDLSVNSTSNPLRMTPDPTETLMVTRGDASIPMAVFDLKASTKLSNIAMKWTDKIQYGDVKPPPLHAHRYLSGYGQEKGGIMCHLYNNDPVNSIRVVYMETVPWYIRLYLHTLEVTNSVKLVAPDKQLYTPGKDRGNPYSMELVLTLPPNSVTSLSIQFDKAYLKWTEHPPDANIGFHIGSAVVTAKMLTPANYTSPAQHQSLLAESFSKHSSDQGFFLRLYTEPLLIQLPTPDFSMPYNVICLACTVVAIGFGSLHNLTTRRFVVSETKKQKGGLLKRILDKFRRTKTEDEKKDEDEKKEEKKEEEKEEEGKKKKTDNLSKKDR